MNLINSIGFIKENDYWIKFLLKTYCEPCKIKYSIKKLNEKVSHAIKKFRKKNKFNTKLLNQYYDELAEFLR